MKSCSVITTISPPSSPSYRILLSQSRRMHTSVTSTSSVISLVATSPMRTMPSARRTSSPSMPPVVGLAGQAPRSWCLLRVLSLSSLVLLVRKISTTTGHSLCELTPSWSLRTSMVRCLSASMKRTPRVITLRKQSIRHLSLTSMLRLRISEPLSWLILGARLMKQLIRSTLETSPSGSSSLTRSSSVSLSVCAM